MPILHRPISRRQLVKGAASAAAWGALGSMAAISRQAHAAAGDRKFLFYFASGAWDATPLDPKFAADGQSAAGGTDMDPGTMLGRAGNLTYSAGNDRLNMDLFFQDWYPYATIVRGVDVHSVAHDTGMQWTLTGSTSLSAPDWPTALAARSPIAYPMPHLVFSGPNYPGTLGGAVVRGGGGTLLRLMDGSINATADENAPAHVWAVDNMIDAQVYRRGDRYGSNRTGAGRARIDAFLGSLERSQELEGRLFEAGLSGSTNNILDQSMMALEVMRLGLARCAMIDVPGTWDTHDDNSVVGPQLDDFYGVLIEVMDYLSRTPGVASSTLLDEVTIVVMSEMGRTPLFNGSGGRDHWAYASQLVLSSQIPGNRVLGATDADFLALPIDLRTGQASSSGTYLGTENVGAALLQFGGVDSDEFLNGVDPLEGLLGEGA